MLEVDQRSNPRHDVPALVPREASVSELYALDLSRGGMRYLRLRGHAPLPPVFAMSVPLPGTGRSVHALAEVVRLIDRGPLEEVAVRFRYLAPEDQRCLDTYLHARARIH